MLMYPSQGGEKIIRQHSAKIASVVGMIYHFRKDIPLNHIFLLGEKLP